MQRLLYLGCTPGEDVRDLQDGLNAVCGLPMQVSAYAALVADGIFGSRTGARVREFQQCNGLPADGVAGPATIGKLDALVATVVGGQASRPIGGASPGPAKGPDGAPVFGKPPGRTGGYGGSVGGGKTGSPASNGAYKSGGGSKTWK